eukprot:CAMPEP_0181085290 /NCGR_PEP_ID=MMETSP1071-20121207/5154_1 /TAXON_ID=35127 /ORGANISM="Thalassiosira sp., Strain NH16" /LENGTH=250 /DNA_ID=CAMNT_0023167089 /DNA_START=186 /DNA_END=938 /DNA_ORIENTATION=+
MAVRNDDPGLSKIEAGAVKRFTISYDKLCKNCPTRLQPRVDTLTEMILGLPAEERDELWNRVSTQLESKDKPSSSTRIPHVQLQGAKSPKDVYDFQTAGVAIKMKPEKREQQSNGKEIVSTNTGIAVTEPISLQQQDVVVDARILRKMKEARAKFDSNRQKLIKARRLLAVTNALLAKDVCKKEPTIYSVANPIDNGWYHDIDRLKTLSRDELKMERMKLMAKRAKFESKVAKGRLKMYQASTKLLQCTQ